MTDEKVIELAKQAGIEFATYIGITGKETTSTLGSQRIEVMQRFAQLVRNEVLEECAKRCEGLTADWGDEAEEAGMRQCADAIRGLKS